MHHLSLKFRSFAAAILSLLIFIPLTVITLEKAFNNSLNQSMLQQLRVQSLTLVSEFEFEENKALMPEMLINDQFNLPESGLYAFIVIKDTVVWNSLSALNWQIDSNLPTPLVGEELFIEDFKLKAPYFLYAYTAEFETEKAYQAVSFLILQNKQVFDTEKDKFAITLWYWLGLISILLIVLLLTSLNAALRPISLLNKHIKSAENGQIKRLDQVYPPELEILKDSINHLLNSEEQQRARYKNSLSDLAHSLKTPLAVLSGTKDLPTDAIEPIHQIDQLIRRQLKRAVIGANGRFEQAILVQPIIGKLIGAMQKVYIDKQLKMTLIDMEEEVRFKGDITDLMEILGNVIDNACKAAKQQIEINCLESNNWLEIRVGDDGPGIPAEQQDQLLERGIRLDSYSEGQGIGMAVVSDLVGAYQGKIEIAISRLGGALITLKFPL